MKNEAIKVDDGNKGAWKMIERLEWILQIWGFENEFFKRKCTENFYWIFF